MKAPQHLWLVLTGLLLFTALFAGTTQAADDTVGALMYDEAAYTEFVENKMQELDALYLRFCETCGVDPVDSEKAKKEFLISVRELMQYMNGRFDALDPKKGAALSPTESLVSIHALTMLVDILAATQIEHMTAHPYVQ
jgi:hypothetical protein